MVGRVGLETGDQMARTFPSRSSVSPHRLVQALPPDFYTLYFSLFFTALSFGPLICQCNHFHLHIFKIVHKIKVPRDFKTPR